MVTWKCPVCGSAVSGFEGEHGTYHGRCPVCGEGFGMYSTDERRQEWWEDRRHPLYAICVEFATGETCYYLIRGWLSHIMGNLEVCDPGTVMTVYDTSTRRPVDRMHARIGWSTCRTVGDEEWLESHGADLSWLKRVREEVRA